MVKINRSDCSASKPEFRLPYLIDYDQFRDLNNLAQRYKVRLNDFPSTLIQKRELIQKPFYIHECFICLQRVETLAHPHLDTCLRCYRNREDRSYNTRSVVVLYGYCELCSREFNSGVRTYNIRICPSCMVKIRRPNANFFKQY